ncbi:MAG: helix-turn-helix domain-containing protein [Clostridia bacterium]|nr:helix-turn-helix domain-containing protein [Clostridia bacterium]
MTQSLGQRIYQYRRANGMSQEDLAESLNVSRQSVSKWETDGSIPDLDKLVALSELFGISLEQLVKGESIEEMNPEPPIECNSCPTKQPPPPTVPTPAPVSKHFWTIKRITGLSLLGFSLFFSFILYYGNAAIGDILIITSPFWLCGVICMTIQRHTGLCCCWGALIGVFFYLSYGSVFSFYNFNLVNTVYAFFRFKEGPLAYWSDMHPTAVAVQVFSSCLTIGLMVLTVIRFSKDTIKVNRRTVTRALIAVIIFTILYIGIRLFYMEMYTLYFQASNAPTSNGFISLSRITNVLSIILTFMRPVAFTALASVLLSFLREKLSAEK